MCYTTAILKKKNQHDASSSAAASAGRISSSNSLQSLPKRAVSPASSTSSSSSSESELLLDSSESSELSAEEEAATPQFHYGGRRIMANLHDDGADAAVENNINRGGNGTKYGPTSQHANNNNNHHHHHWSITIFSSYNLLSLVFVVLLATFVLHFSLWFPFVLPYQIGSAAYRTYEPAWYIYDAMHTKFDNTVWTYGTDYGLTLVMCYLAWRCWKGRGRTMATMTTATTTTTTSTTTAASSSFRLRLYSSSLLLCYGLSTLAGGLAHQYFTSLEVLNTSHFRWLWTICVGNVAFASGYMGLIGREVQKIFGVKNGMVPLGPWWFWPAYGIYMACAVAMGYMSFKRPACDIFIAGITQFPTTFYCLGALGLRKWPSSSSSSSSSGTKTTTSATTTIDHVSTSPIGHVRLPYRIMYYVGFIGNAPLLPMYPLLVQYSGMSLAGINTLLHSWLMIMWGMQGVSLLHLLNAIDFHRLKVSRD